MLCAMSSCFVHFLKSCFKIKCLIPLETKHKVDVCGDGHTYDARERHDVTTSSEDVSMKL